MMDHFIGTINIYYIIIFIVRYTICIKKKKNILYIKTTMRFAYRTLDVPNTAGPYVYAILFYFNFILVIYSQRF